MASLKTECTELSVGFGLLNVKPQGLTSSQIETYFEGTLSFDKYRKFLREFIKSEDYYRRFWAIGFNLRGKESSFANLQTVRWEGPTQQANTVSMAKDLVAQNTAISVKADSNVVFNLSLHSLFISIPSGSQTSARSENWYYKIAPDAFQAFYSCVRNKLAPDYPENAADYLLQVKGKKNRKRLANAIKQLAGEEAKECNRLYLEMCHEVAERSADLFNNSFAQSLNGPAKIAVIEQVIRNLFRIGDTSYILCGLDKNQEFAVKIPDLTTWKREWQFRDLVASPDLSRGQSVVDFVLNVETKRPRKPYTLGFHVQIRWGHGKLNGNPEAKFYKEFVWTDVPFLESIYSSDGIKKRLSIGSGGFGDVYEAELLDTGSTVAVKELKPQANFEDARDRFEKEVQIQKSLNHRNILPILRENLDAKPPWFAMPLAKCSLSDRNDVQGNIEEIHRIFWQILEGMDYAYKQGVIHRDLKPDNILFTDEGVLQISDFGLGKRPADLKKITKSSNNSMGTFAYASPEQMQSFRDADHRSDIYSIGKLLFFLVTGEEPLLIDLGRLDEPYKSIIAKCIQTDPGQ
ncbi:protein kinase [bacterium]|nr:protein kinase [bacterium]